MTNSRFSTRTDVQNYLKISNFPRVLEVGAGFKPWESSTVLVDAIDIKDCADGREFHRLDLDQCDQLPFEDHSFDFVTCVHCLEHLSNPIFWINEFSRLAPEGYIEVPCRLEDNLTSYMYGDPYGHKWWFVWNTVHSRLDITYRMRLLSTISLEQFNKENWLFLKESVFRIGVHWRNKLDYSFNQNTDLII